MGWGIFSQRGRTTKKNPRWVVKNRGGGWLNWKTVGELVGDNGMLCWSRCTEEVGWSGQSHRRACRRARRGSRLLRTRQIPATRKTINIDLGFYNILTEVWLLTAFPQTLFMSLLLNLSATQRVISKSITRHRLVREHSYIFITPEDRAPRPQLGPLK